MVSSDDADMQQREDPNSLDGIVIVVAKCPIPGKSKTRLAPLLGDEGAAELAKAMLCDVLFSLSTAPELEHVPKILLFAPSSGDKMMKEILSELGFVHQWNRMPMLDQGHGHLQSSDLGEKLTHALIEARRLGQPGPIIFLGMDCPELPLDEISSALKSPDVALLCPALDGGYGMLSVPDCVEAAKVFLPLSSSPAGGGGVSRWSTSLTAVAQLKALTDAHVPVRLGRLMYDMDEPPDVQALIDRIRRHRSSTTERIHNIQGQGEEDRDCLEKSSNGGVPRTALCRYTQLALETLGHL